MTEKRFTFGYIDGVKLLMDNGKFVPDSIALELLNEVNNQADAVRTELQLCEEENTELQKKNEELKQRCKELRNDLIDHSALINMLEKARALDIEDMIWNTMGYKTQTEFDDDFADYREDAKKRWRE